jgi:hypothetical protein
VAFSRRWQAHGAIQPPARPPAAAREDAGSSSLGRDFSKMYDTLVLFEGYLCHDGDGIRLDGMASVILIHSIRDIFLTDYLSYPFGWFHGKSSGYLTICRTVMTCGASGVLWGKRRDFTDAPAGVYWCYGLFDRDLAIASLSQGYRVG